MIENLRRRWKLELAKLCGIDARFAPRLLRQRDYLNALGATLSAEDRRVKVLLVVDDKAPIVATRGDILRAATAKREAWAQSGVTREWIEALRRDVPAHEVLVLFADSTGPAQFVPIRVRAA